MSKSLLLHALSLNDRILEPHSLPLHGRVWAYIKEDCTRDGFIGHCLTMLSQLGLTAGGISLGKKDIVAFDAQAKERTYTVVISLADDSLASRYFYFLGLWQHMNVFNKVASLPEPSADSDVLRADFQYETYFSDRPVQRDVCDKLVTGDVFGQQLYEGRISLIGNDPVTGSAPVGFVLFPSIMTSGVPREEVQHALYSLRNMMALRAQVMRTYQKGWDREDEAGLYKEAMALMRKVCREDVVAGDWDRLVCDNGETLLRLAELAAQRSRQQGEVRNLGGLFESIVGELKASDMSDVPPLWPRLRLPFATCQDLLDERASILLRTGKQCEIILQLLHSRMLLQQQKMLSLIADSIAN